MTSSSPAADPALIALLDTLAISLSASQKALLTLDLAEIERGTAEQKNLCCEILACLQKDAAAELPTAFRDGTGLQALRVRVLHLTRVQAALLSRAQRSLHAIASLIGGPGTTYSPRPGQQTYAGRCIAQL